MIERPRIFAYVLGGREVRVGSADDVDGMTIPGSSSLTLYFDTRVVPGTGSVRFVPDDYADEDPYFVTRSGQRCYELARRGTDLAPCHVKTAGAQVQFGDPDHQTDASLKDDVMVTIYPGNLIAGQSYTLSVTETSFKSEGGSGRAVETWTKRFIVAQDVYQCVMGEQDKVAPVHPTSSIKLLFSGPIFRGTGLIGMGPFAQDVEDPDLVIVRNNPTQPEPFVVIIDPRREIGNVTRSDLPVNMDFTVSLPENSFRNLPADDKVCTFSTLWFDDVPPRLLSISNIGYVTPYGLTDPTSQSGPDSAELDSRWVVTFSEKVLKNNKASAYGGGKAVLTGPNGESWSWGLLADTSGSYLGGGALRKKATFVEEFAAFTAITPLLEVGTHTLTLRLIGEAQTLTAGTWKLSVPLGAITDTGRRTGGDPNIAVLDPDAEGIELEDEYTAVAYIWVNPDDIAPTCTIVSMPYVMPLNQGFVYHTIVAKFTEEVVLDPEGAFILYATTRMGQTYQEQRYQFNQSTTIEYNWIKGCTDYSMGCGLRESDVLESAGGPLYLYIFVNFYADPMGGIEKYHMTLRNRLDIRDLAGNPITGCFVGAADPKLHLTRT
jgi:hypothetical protein